MVKKIRNIHKKTWILILALTMFIAYTKVTAFANENNLTQIEHNQTFSDASINEGLGIARDYGLFTNYFTYHSDLEGTVAAKEANFSTSGDYNFSSNNYNVNKNKISVTKSYVDLDGNPVSNASVTLRLYRVNGSSNELIEEKTGITNGDGQFTLDFGEGNQPEHPIIDGTYEVREVITDSNGNQQEIKNGSFVTEDGKEVNVSNSGQVTISTGYSNVSHFGKITSDGIGYPRAGSYVVLENQSDYDKFKSYNARPNVKIFKSGTNGYSDINWNQEFNKLNTFSTNLAHAQDSSDVKVYNLTQNDLTRNEGWDFQDEGKKWLVINVEVNPQTNWINMMTSGYKRNGITLDGSFTSSTTDKAKLEKQSNVIWNFYTLDNQQVVPYQGTLRNERNISGIVLIPSATMDQNAHVGGTVISNSYSNTNELHQKRDVTPQNENIYVSNTEDGVSQIISGAKDLVGRPLQKDEFTFALQQYTDDTFKTATGNVLTTTNDANGNFNFVLKYTQAGDYYYQVTEVNNNLKDIEYSDNVYQVKVSVVEENNKLKAKSPEVIKGSSTFTNEYKSKTSLDIEGKKTVTNDLPLNANDYTFKFQETDSQWKVKSNGYNESTTNSKNGTFKFDDDQALKYTQKDIGKHYYVLSEDRSSKIKGVVYDDAKYYITVTVAYNPETQKLEATKEVKKGNDVVENIEFVNSYSSNGEATIKGTKKLTGRKFSNTDNFEFELYETGSDYALTEGQQPVKTASITNVSNTKEKDFDFNLSYEDIAYNQTQTHYYVVKEKNTGIDGIDYDGQSYKVKVTVKDQKDGTASTQVDVEDNKAIEFTNKFNYKGSTNISIQGTKTLANKTLKANDFTFSLQEYKDENHKTKLGDALETKNDKDGNIEFDLTYDQNHLGNHYYVLSEKDENGNGIQYDKQKYDVTVTVSYDEDKQSLEVTKTITDEKGNEAQVKFENKYASSISTVIEGTKKLEGRSFNANDNFTFELYETGSDYKIKDDVLKTTTINKNDVGKNESTFKFDTLEYKNLKANETQTHYYVVKEKTPENNNLNGVTYDTTIYKVKVVVEDDGNGHATATQTIVGQDQIEFVNRYNVSGSTQLTLHKVLNGGTLKGNDFTFKVEQVNQDGKVLSNGQSGTAKNNANGIVNFNINFEKAGTYYFKVSEVNTNKSNITYDPIEYLVKVDVKDNGKGQLVATQKVVKYENATMTPSDDEKNALTFKNSVGVQIVGKKNLSNRKLRDNEFTFKLSKVDYNEKTHKYSTIRELKTTTNDENGNFSFAGFDSYSESGTYYYLVEEVKGTDEAIEYDTTRYIVPIVVSREGNGLAVEQGQIIELNKDDVKDVEAIEFDNVYHCHGSVEITGKKELLDHDEIQTLTGNEFSFSIERVKNANGDVYEGKSDETISRKSVKNDADGVFKFNLFYQNLDFTKQDQYTFYYKITEDQSGNVVKGITYNASKKEYIVKVDVTDNGDGSYTAVKSLLNGENIVFTNTVNASGETKIIGTKSLTGKALDDQEFAFEIQETDDSYKVLDKGYKDTVKNDQDGGFEFNIKNYTKPGTYYYKVTEKQDKAKTGITFDDAIYYVKVVARYDQDDRSRIITTNTYYDENQNKVDAIEFKNEFKATGSVTLKGKKNFVDENNQDVDFDAGDFEFKLEELTKDGFVKENGMNQTVKNDENKEYSFKLDYTKPGTYYYRVSEVKDQDNYDVAYDQTVYHVTVQVKADDTDTLKVSKTITYGDELGESQSDRESLDFTNTLYQYQLATMSLEGNKVVSGSQAIAMEPGLFRFELIDQNQDKRIDTAKNDAVGTYAFDDIQFTQPGNYNYTVKEMNAGNEIAGVSYTNQELNVNAQVSRDQQGNLVIDYTNVTDQSGNEMNDAINISSAQLVNQSTKDIHVKKVWDDAGHEDQRQTVTVDLVRNGKVVEGQKVLLSNDNNWNASFTDLPVSDQEGNPYVYSVKEEKINGYQVEYSQEDGSYVITNKYIDVTSTNVQLEAHKDLIGGKELSAGMYQFDLLSNGEVIDTQVNDDQGDIHFNTLTFDHEGTYVYEVKEHISENDPHIEYDQSVYKVNVDVKRQDNHLVSNVSYSLDDQSVDRITFTNIYHPLNLTVQKRSKDLSQDPLLGAVYGLYRVNTKGSNILVEKQTSNNDGYMTFNNAVPGYKYYFKEISAPEGHTVDEYKTKNFEVSYQRSKTGQVSYKLVYEDENEAKTTPLTKEENNLTASDEVVLAESQDYTISLEAVGVADEVTKLTVSKLDQDGQYLKGAHLQIIEKDTNKVVCDWVSTDSSYATLRKLNVDTVYILREVEAPEGYKKAQDTEFKLDDYGIVTKLSGDGKLVDDQTFNLYNTKETTQKVVYKENRKTVTTHSIRNVFVKTGDNTNIVLYVVIMVLAGVLFIVLYKRNKKE